MIPGTDIQMLMGFISLLERMTGLFSFPSIQDKTNPPWPFTISSYINNQMRAKLSDMPPTLKVRSWIAKTESALLRVTERRPSALNSICTGFECVQLAVCIICPTCSIYRTAVKHIAYNNIVFVCIYQYGWRERFNFAFVTVH